MARRKKDIDRRLSDVVAEHIVALVEAITDMVRQDTAREIADLVGGSSSLALRRARRRRILPCIAPSCKNPSKGPRFHYLCDDHRDAPRREWEAWQEARREGTRPNARRARKKKRPIAKRSKLKAPTAKSK